MSKPTETITASYTERAKLYKLQLMRDLLDKDIRSDEIQTLTWAIREIEKWQDLCQAWRRING